MAEKSKKVIKGATEALKLLWEKGFFKEWQNYSQVVGRFTEDDYHFASSDLGMALKRVKYLTRRGKRGNYEYIQKYPFIKEEKHGKSKKNN